MLFPEGFFMQNQISKKNINKILEYWYTIEFLGQDSFPRGNKYIERMKNYKRNLKQGKANNIKQLIAYSDITNTEIIKTVHNEVIKCGMSCWGNITIYIGKVRREDCIKELISRLGGQVKDNRPEFSVDYIALASFQVTANGDYVNNSLSLSPVLWAIKQIRSEYDDIAEKINRNLYDNNILELEKILAPKEANEESYIITLEDVNKLYLSLYNNYIRNVFKTDVSVEKTFAIIYQIFSDELAKDKYEDDIYTGLSRDYFSQDIKMLIDKNVNGKLNKTIQDYILSLHKAYVGNEDVNRIDVVNNDKHEEYELQLNRIMRVKNAPLGKWPSKYMPALMQQMAINLSVHQSIWKQFGENGKIFSVNGPPGTGKTTLLKEIVSNNIVERANLLVQYDNPDDAFCEHNFENGTKEGHAYSKYVKHWYKLEDPKNNGKINDYSILVTSCNNAAVENISKELPVSKGILDNLNSNDDEALIIKEQLNEVSKLFDVSMSKDIEKIFNWDSTKKGEFTDIYFTEYANELLDIDNAWGLIAAPLGNKSNIKKFYYKVLSNLLRDFYQTREQVNARLRLYRNVCKKFKSQYDVVVNMQQQLDKYGKLSEKRITDIREKNRIIDDKLKEVNSVQEKILQWNIDLKENDLELDLHYNKFKDIEIKRTEAEVKVQKINIEYQSLEQQLFEIKEKILNIENSVGFFARFFKTRKYRYVINLTDLLRKKSFDIENMISDIKAQNVFSRDQLSLLDKEYTDKKNQIERLNENKRSLQRNILSSTNRINILNKEIDTARNDIKTIQNEYIQVIRELTCNEIDRRGIAIDEGYINKIFSKDVKESTESQVENPWFTQLYNREREKLFYYALKLNKEFVLSSHACRLNLKSLGHYWGYLKGDDEKAIKFCESRESDFVMSLIQTLFLLVPVISSTFASVGSFFKDIKQSGVVGLLVVDEAGQAQPQMALGALYRSRKALIVGDPKQIEPVVTDDLKLLKEAYRENIYNPYKEKKGSVQICADLMNPFGTYMDNGTDNPDWIGCPLLVHRRCISPMYDISNTLSYNGIMKQQTHLPKLDLEKKFIYGRSQWINIIGNEDGKRNHFVKAQGKKVCEMLEIAFGKDKIPDIFIISPFTTVVKGMREYIQSYCKNNMNSPVNYALQEWIYKNIGTVHTFQGKEAKEVIFILGCDSSKEASGAINWVNKNIVNVAVTRAKYRLYIIGDEKAWSNSDCIGITQRIMKSFSTPDT